MKSVSLISTVLLALSSAVLAEPGREPYPSPSYELAPLTVDSNTYFAPSADKSRGSFYFKNAQNPQYCFDLKGSVKQPFPDGGTRIFVHIYDDKDMVYKSIQALCDSVFRAPASLGCKNAEADDTTIYGCVNIESATQAPSRRKRRAYPPPPHQPLGTAHVDFITAKDETFYHASGPFAFRPTR
ncbi:hypothetical protein B0O80DRAFT_458030 [Mortierella sp. GBAus27b]|nr:hypothetical protein BGX31_009967 [Mortierella sp. GBA43]KAI8350530.1 hypothetical protein B0O80DRAFT_458030 [Mortierella sp. GBAus27b]